MRRLLVIVAVIALAAFGTGIAVANTTGGSLLCYDLKTGEVRVDVLGSGCLKKEGAVAVIAGGVLVERIDVSSVAVAGDTTSAFAGCPVGEVVTGGGYVTFSINTELRPFSNVPIEVDGVQGWQVSIINESGGDVTFHAFALCVPGTAAGYD